MIAGRGRAARRVVESRPAVTALLVGTARTDEDALAQAGVAVLARTAVAAEAARLVTRLRPALVIVDVDGGSAALAAIDAVVAAAPLVPVLAVAAAPGHDVVLAAVRAGATSVLRTPGERAAGEQAGEWAAGERAAGEQAARERAADERAADERAADERAADEQAEGEQAADEQAEDEQAEDERAADEQAGELAAGVRATARGTAVFSPGLAEAVLVESGRPVDPQLAVRQLTEREADVVGLVVEGLTARQIATRLGLSPRTVENHVQRVLRKLQLHSRAALVRYAIERGLG